MRSDCRRRKTRLEKSGQGRAKLYPSGKTDGSEKRKDVSSNGQGKQNCFSRSWIGRDPNNKRRKREREDGVERKWEKSPRQNVEQPPTKKLAQAPVTLRENWE